METHSVAALFLALGIVIVASRLAGTVARRLGQPRVVGELAVGVLLGPTILNVLTQPIFHDADLAPTIKEFGELGVLILMFIIGLEVDIEEMVKVGRVAGLAGFLGAVVPVLMTVPIVMLFGYGWQPALFAGVTLAATSVSISAQVLLELGYLRTKEGSALLATALVDDVLAIILVSLSVVLVGAGEADSGAGSLIGIILRMVLYLLIAGLLAWFVLPRLVMWISRRPTLAQSFGVESFALIFMLFFAWSAEELGGVATITGAFLAGVGFSRIHDDLKHRIEGATRVIAYAFLVPIFFINVGLETDLRTFTFAAIPLTIGLLAAAVLSKLIGCGLGAKWAGFSNTEALRLGVCMISRGEVGLIIASIGISAGVFNAEQPLFASLFMVILLTTLVTPMFVRLVFRGRKGRSA
jgi:Kef-type K+ transport system membrane component KefB